MAPLRPNCPRFLPIGIDCHEIDDRRPVCGYRFSVLCACRDGFGSSTSPAAHLCTASRRCSARERMPRPDGNARWRDPVDPVVSHFAQHVLQLDVAGRINGVPCPEPHTWVKPEVYWGQEGLASGSLITDGKNLPRPSDTQRGQLPSFADCGNGVRPVWRPHRIRGGYRRGVTQFKLAVCSAVGWEVVPNEVGTMASVTFPSQRDYSA